MSAQLDHPACVSRILEAALDVFSEQGYGASIEQIASRASVARQTIYNHFGGKQALFETALEQAISALFETVKAEDAVLRERLIRFGLVFRARVLSPRSIRLHRVLTGEAPRVPDLARSFFDRCFLGSTAQMASVLQRAMRDGELRRDDARDSARLFMEMLIGPDRWRMLLGGEPPDPATEKDNVTRMVDHFLRAYAPFAEPAVRSAR
jgi:TetR/AcrR family transcriptional repressor of mexJK operon